jgi:IS30 family transposase
MNGLLRQYFPKGTDLNWVSLERVQFVAAEMNGRPRKVLDWRTPSEVYADVIAMAS